MSQLNKDLEYGLPQSVQAYCDYLIVDYFLGRPQELRRICRSRWWCQNEIIVNPSIFAGMHYFKADRVIKLLINEIGYVPNLVELMARTEDMVEAAEGLFCQHFPGEAPAESPFTEQRLRRLLRGYSRRT